METPRHQLPSEALARRARAEKRASGATAASHAALAYHAARLGLPVEELVDGQAVVAGRVVRDPAQLSEGQRTAIRRAARVTAELLRADIEKQGSAWAPHGPTGEVSK